MEAFENDTPSKSQKKRDMDELKVLAARLLELTADDVNKIPDARVLEAVVAGKKITKGNAKKRQLQFIAKLISKVDIEPIRNIVDVLDASSTHHLKIFHQLETWRERLITGDESVMSEIFGMDPQADRPKLRALVRNAINERERGDQNVHFRKLFQFLKTLNSPA